MRHAILQVFAITLFAFAGSSAAIQLEIVYPAGPMVNDPIYVVAKVDGGTGGQAVSATLGGRTVALTKGTYSVCNGAFEPPLCVFPPAWTATFDATGIPSGEHTLVVTATDGAGGSTSASRPLVLDRLPSIQVSQPAPYATAWLQQRVTASCADDFGCVSITLRIRGNVILTGTSSIDGLVNLAPYDGERVDLEFQAKDTAGNFTYIYSDIPIFVEGSPHVRPIAKVPGEIRDVDAGRILFRRSSDLTSLEIRDRASGADTVVSSGWEVQAAGLTSAGAAFTVFQRYGNAVMSTGKSWEADTLVGLGTPPCCFVSTNGRYVTWMEDPTRILRRDTLSATTSDVAPSSEANVPGAYGGPRLGPVGQVAFWGGSANPGLMFSDPAANPVLRMLVPYEPCRWGTPRTDGATVVFELGNCNARKVKAYRAGAVSPILDAGQYDSVSYDVAGGWIGVARAYTGTPGSVVRADPQGNLQQLTPPANTIQLQMDRINSDGTLAFLDGMRHVSPPGSTNVYPVGSRLGSAHFIGGTLHVALGDTLFAYQRASPAPAKRYHHFGIASMGMGTPDVPISLTNDSGTSLTGITIAASANFTVTHDCATLAPAQQCTAHVAFRPRAIPTALNGRVDVGGELTVGSSAMAAPYRVSLWGIAERSFVSHYYSRILGRAPDTAGQAYWEAEAARMSSLGADVNEAWYAMAMAFFSSAEYTATARTTAAYVTNLYETFFGRAPDAGGLAHWSSQVDAGLPRDVALAAFMFSPEFTGLSRAVFGTAPARAETDMVVDFYRGLLGRLPDSDGMNFWLGRFRAAQCLGASAVRAEVEAISAAFAGSGEYAGRQRSNVGYVADLYNAFLRRGGDLNGVKFWIDQSNAGRTREQLRRDFIASPEFEARVQAVVTQGCAQT